MQNERTSEQTRGTETEAESETVSGEPRRCLRRQSLKFLFSNTDAMTNKKEEISARLVSEKPDVFGLMEIKPKKHGFVLEEADIAFEGYDAFYSKQINNKEHRGTIVYVRQDIGLPSSRVEINGCPEDTILVQLCNGKKKKSCSGAYIVTGI